VRVVSWLPFRSCPSFSIERGVRGSAAGYKTPLANVDLPGGGGKCKLLER
jgi:hypothetical protein